MALGNIGDILGILDNPKIKQYLPALLALIELLKGLGDRKPADPLPPVEDDGPDPTDGPLAPPVAPEPMIRRVPAEIRANWTGIARKKHPYQEGGGRVRVSAQGFRKVMTDQDGLQAGDVVDINITPSDQFGKPFLPGEGANELLLRPDGYPGFVHEISGKGYLVRHMPDEHNPHGCTPSVRIPSTFQDEEVKPGFRGTVGDTIKLPLDANGKACELSQAVKVLSVTLPTLRVTPWAAD